jgi:hypothetical protein
LEHTEHIFFHISEYPPGRVPEVGDEVQFRLGTRNQKPVGMQIVLLPKGSVQLHPTIEEVNINGVVVVAVGRAKERDFKTLGQIVRCGLRTCVAKLTNAVTPARNTISQTGMPGRTSILAVPRSCGRKTAFDSMHMSMLAHT